MSEPDTLEWEGEIPLAQVLEQCSPAYGDSWQGVADTLQSDRIENAIVDTLINESLETGLFQTPIYIEIHEPCEGGDKCDDIEGHGEWCVKIGEPTRYVVTNGTHRIVAAMTAAYDTIKVTSVYEPPDLDLDEGTLVFTFKTTLTEDGQYLCPDCDDFGECFAFCVLRSFRLSPEWWAECLLASRVNAEFHLYFDVPVAMKDALEAEVLELAKTHGVQLDEFEVHIEREEDFDD